MKKEMEKWDEIMNEVICGDAIEVLKIIPNDSIDLVITSPPYYKQREYGGIGIGNESNLMNISKI